MSWNDDTQKWEVDVMSNDVLPPDSLVGRMLNPLTDETGTGEVSFDPEPTPLPLWRVMQEAYGSEPTVAGGLAAEIEALRDWLLKIPPAEFFSALGLDGREEPVQIARCAVEWLRDLLTEQARIARGDNA